nr:unnamed protein product [Haemonchus contortus]
MKEDVAFLPKMVGHELSNNNLLVPSLRNFKMVLPYTVNEEYDDAVMTTSFLPREMVEKSRFATEIIETFNAWKERKLNAAKVYTSLQVMLGVL